MPKAPPSKPCEPTAPARQRSIRRRLLAWYDAHRRRLPWRAEPPAKPNPYHALVSEAMLQQTQVATVLPYFDRFIEMFPTVHDLAGADEQAVLRLWQGLGYYRRARSLHAAAKTIVQTHAGRVPDRVDLLRKLPGVGRYTAGAIASIAFGQPEPILDGNVARVLARLFLIDQPTDTPKIQKTLWHLAEQLVPQGRPGDFNQAMMELGALVCTKANPSCDTCPLSSDCEALRARRVADVPVPATRKPPKTVHHHVLAIHRRGRYLFQQRPASGLWSNMWQLPTAEELPAKSSADTFVVWADKYLGLVVDRVQKIDTFTHQTTHRTIHFHIWLAPATSGRLRRGTGQWRGLNQIDDLPLPNPQRKAVAMLQDIIEPA